MSGRGEKLTASNDRGKNSKAKKGGSSQGSSKTAKKPLEADFLKRRLVEGQKRKWELLLGTR